MTPPMVLAEAQQWAGRPIFLRVEALIQGQVAASPLAATENSLQAARSARGRVE